MEVARSNAQLVVDLLAAYQRGDDDALRALVHPEGEIYGQPGLINAGTYHGFDGFRDWISQWEEAWNEASYELGEMTEVGDSLIVVPVRIVARGAGSGVEVDTVFGWLFEWMDSRVSRFHVYVDVDEALVEARRLGER
jgi:ketosteroid isomerase-like protein